jgi:hypothetical protein
MQSLRNYRESKALSLEDMMGGFVATREIRILSRKYKENHLRGSKKPVAGTRSQMTGNGTSDHDAVRSYKQSGKKANWANYSGNKQVKNHVQAFDGK